MSSEYQHQISQPIIFKRGTSLAAPVLLWLMDALPAVLAGVMFYPLTRIYDVEFDKPFLVLSILAATCTLAVMPPRNSTSQIVSGRLELATNLLLRWAVLVAALLALGYVTKFSEDFSRRVVVTWVLRDAGAARHAVARPAGRHARAAARRRAGAARRHRRLHRRRAWSSRARLKRHVELGISVAGFFDDRGSDRLGCSEHAQLLGRFSDVAVVRQHAATST